MSADDQVSELLLRWEELRDGGKPSSPEDLCKDSPELLGQLQDRIRVLEAMDSVLKTVEDKVADTATWGEAPLAQLVPSPGVLPGGKPAPSIPGYEILGELGRGG